MLYSLDNYPRFLDQIFLNLDSVKIGISGYQVDHLAFRAHTPGDYKKYLGRFTQNNEILGENTVRDRPIAIIRFTKPLVYKNISIPFLELMAPAADFAHPNGLEHIEVIVPDLDEFQQKHSAVRFELSARSRQINPELILRFPNHANIKFHTRPIDEAFYLQKKLGIL